MSARRATLLEALEAGGEISQAALAELLESSAAEREDLVDLAVARSLVALLGDASRTRQRQAAEVIRALAGESAPLSRALDEALASPSARLRWGAAYTLGHAAPAPPLAIWPVVRETLALADGDQRWAAAELSCELARSHPSVLDALHADLAAESPTARKMVLYCLRDLAVPELARLARERLKDPDSGVRLAALSAIARDPEKSPELRVSAIDVSELVDRDPDPGVRRSAAVALGRLGVTTPEVMATLSRAEQSDDESLKRAATGALARLGRSN